MHANITGLTAAGLSIGAFAFTRSMLLGKSRRRRWAWLGIFTLLAVPALLFGIYYLHVLPEQAWFYTLRSWRGSEFLMIFAGCAAGAAATFLPRPLLVLPLLALIVLAAGPYAKPLLGPLPDNMFSEQRTAGVFRQSNASTCGPASVCTILSRLGAVPSEMAAARSAYSCLSGTEAWYLARYVRSLGYAARFEFRESFSPEAGLPAVVGVRLGHAGHFIAVLEVAEDRVTFADPLFGEQQLPLPEFRKRYQFTGFHMVIAKE